MAIWLFVVNGLLGFGSHINMNKVENERGLYDVLKTHVVEPGRYVVNPEVDPEVGFALNEPVFSVSYSGMGHEAAGWLMIVSLITVFVSTILAAWLLSVASRAFKSGYLRRVLYFAGIGILFAVSVDLEGYNIGGYPLDDTLLLMLNRFGMWTFVGVVVAWLLKPEPSAGNAALESVAE